MFQTVLAGLVKKKFFQKSLVKPYLRLNKWVWKCLPPSLITLRPITTYGNFLNTLVRLCSKRKALSITCFFRNRPELELIRRLSDRKKIEATLNLAVLACSQGAEVYSVLWTIRSIRPDLKITIHAVDISKEALDLARQGIYSLTAHHLGGLPIHQSMTEKEIGEIFDREGDRIEVRPSLKEGIVWHLGDAGGAEMLNTLGLQDIVMANRFLFHMDPPDAERMLRNIARLVHPGGYLFVSGIDLDLRMKVAVELGWRAVQDSMEEIYNGDPSIKIGWPWKYWGLEPLNKRRDDWKIRYASVFQL